MQDGMSCGACGDGGSCKCPHHKLVPLFVALIGFVFLLGGMNVISKGLVDLAWPILLILVGLQKMCGGMCKCCGPK